PDELIEHNQKEQAMSKHPHQPTPSTTGATVHTCARCRCDYRDGDGPGDCAVALREAVEAALLTASLSVAQQGSAGIGPLFGMGTARGVEVATWHVRRALGVA